jgi:hypothetical protein
MVILTEVTDVIRDMKGRETGNNCVHTFQQFQNSAQEQAHSRPESIFARRERGEQGLVLMESQTNQPNDQGWAKASQGLEKNANLQVASKIFKTAQNQRKPNSPYQKNSN